MRRGPTLRWKRMRHKREQQYHTHRTNYWKVGNKLNVFARFIRDGVVHSPVEVTWLGVILFELNPRIYHFAEQKVIFFYRVHNAMLQNSAYCFPHLSVCPFGYNACSNYRTEDSRVSYRVDWYIVTVVSKDNSVFILEVEQCRLRRRKIQCG